MSQQKYSANTIRSTLKQLINHWQTDNDGFVNMIDVTVIIDYILNKNPSSFYFTNSDVNKDGLINMLDVTAIIEIILGK